MTTTTRPQTEVADSAPELSTGQAAHMDMNPIDLGRIEVLQVLDEHGNVDQARDPGLSDSELLAVHRAMVLTRSFDSRMLTMQRQGEMGTFAPNLGQEACMIGQVWELTRQDWFSPSYRSFGAQIHRGWPMERLFLLWSGYHEGFPPPEGVNDMPFSIVIGSHVLPAVGIAMGMRRRNNNDCVVVNFGDGAMSQGAVSEAFNFAMVDRAPVVFVCENNGWAISTPTKLQYATDHLAGRGVAFGLSSIRVDGNDILGMIAAMREATRRARDGEGPTFVEAITYRMSLHTTADDPTVYRDSADSDPWHSRCPINRMEKYLEGRGLLSKEAAEKVKLEADAEVLEARERFRKIAKARPREVFDHLYKVTPSELEDQRNEYLSRLDRKGVD
ncbi:MAG: pyruvate dehydrogenase (acetyl-transferring) E1 component subunit alpha [Phycisphaerae bacterium]|nr:pyruvate dehydrogenase (acetyl-transferring) E1 component subunit alpha [Phycisphaerae bacterium]|tara:strand:+ start:3949 stop:5109 length:1161 start_codon:yes stop_codon:yes gene_type:complete